jgi:hypothetical protein
MCLHGFSFPARNCCVAIALALFAILAPLNAQDQHRPVAHAASLDQSIHELQVQVRELQSALVAMRDEITGYRSEILKTRRELEDARTHLALEGGVAHVVKASSPETLWQRPANDLTSSAQSQPMSDLSARLAKLEEDNQLLNSRVDEQYQTKVESASKYRARLSGIALLNAFASQGSVDNLDFPALALPPATLDSGGAFGASLRQSQLGLEVFGPQFRGAKIAADVQMDFAGGFPNTLNGVTFGLMRLRTATLRLDWPHTSIVAGQDTLFFSPLSPTSFATLAVPALSYAGNLWAWVPQVRVEQRTNISGDSTVTWQAGILDPLSGQPAGASFLRSSQAGERSRQPAYAARLAWTRGQAERTFVIGLGGYYSRQNWGFGRGIDGWAAMLDWSLPLTHRLGLTGKLYRGRAVGGLDGAFGRSIVTSGALSDPATSVRGLNSAGGWAQLKFRASSTLEFNGAMGQENPWANDLRRFPLRQLDLYPSAARNRASFVNFIYRPRSDLVFSAEYRRLRTFGLSGENQTANHINLIMGILF